MRQRWRGARGGRHYRADEYDNTSHSSDANKGFNDRNGGPEHNSGPLITTSADHAQSIVNDAAAQCAGKKGEKE